MIVRIRLKRGPIFQHRPGKRRRLALVMSVLLTPAALTAAVLALWRLAADMNWAGEFAIAHGPFSHWQVWIAMAAALQLLAARLNRYARGGAMFP